MNLFILTNSDGSPIADKTVAAVTSMTDVTALDDLGNLVLGDSEPLVIKFTTGIAAPAFAGDATYSLSVALGAVTADGTYNYSNTSAFATTTAGWTGRLALAASELIAAIFALGGGICATVWGDGNPRGGWLTLQVRVTNPNGYTVTYALLRVFVEWRVVPADATDTASSSSFFAAVQNRAAITGLASSVSDETKLGGLQTAGTIPAGAVFALNLPVSIVEDDSSLTAGFLTLLYQLRAGAATTSAPLRYRPYDYDASTNALTWQLVGSWLGYQPASYNSVTGKFHRMYAYGSANAVGMSADQIGTSAPA